MPAVFVHGNPETSAVWDPLLSQLRRSDVVAVSLPGFGIERRNDFGATKDEYVDWLVTELVQLGEPVDLVGHDWGGFLTVRLASLRGDPVRSWASDGLNAFDERFEWHDFAKIWQTAEAGEAWVENQLATPVRERASLLERFGVPRDVAPTVASWFDRTMGESMLALYRSATDIGCLGLRALTRSRRPASRSSRPLTRSGTMSCSVRPPRELTQAASSWRASAIGGCLRTPLWVGGCWRPSGLQ